MSWVELDDTGYLGVHGVDARSFLQGQLTNDMGQLGPARALRAAATTPQGRVLALMDAFAIGDAILLALPRTEIGVLRERLARYVLRARVELRDESEAWRALGALDGAAVATLARALGPVPAHPGGVAQHGELLVIAIDRTPRVAVLGPRAALGAFAATLPAGRAPLERWRLADIRAGLPAILPETREMFVPQMLNLDALDALSFTKGCYTGQEIVARTQHLGRIKRRMLRVRASEPTPPAPGATVYARGEVTGHVVRAARDEQGAYELLATVSIVDAAHPLELGHPGGAALMRLPLPYGIAELDGGAPAA